MAEIMKKQRQIRKLHSYNEEKPYIVVKRDLNGNWNNKGRSHTKRGIATFYHQNQIHPEYKIFTRPEELKTEIEGLVKKLITSESKQTV